MPKYLYVGEMACVEREYVKSYLQGSKYVEINDTETLRLTIKQLFSDITCVLGSADREAIRVVQLSKIKKNLSVITDSICVAKELEHSVAGIILVDEYTKTLPSLWNTKIVSLSNVLKLRSEGIQSVRFNIDKANLSSMHYLSILDDDKGCRAEFTSMSEKKSVEDFKASIKKIKKDALGLLKNSKKNNKIELKENISLAKQGTVLEEVSSMKEYLVSRGFITQTQLDSLDKTKEPIELQLANRGIISFEDLTEIVRYYYNLEMLGKEELRAFIPKFNKVSDTMQDKGVVEVYDVEDTDYNNTFIIIPYDKRDVLLYEINSTINYKKSYFAVPAYTKGLIEIVKST